MKSVLAVRSSRLEVVVRQVEVEMEAGGVM